MISEELKDLKRTYNLTPDVVLDANRYHNAIRDHIDEIFEKQEHDQDWFSSYEQLRYDLYFMYRDNKISLYTKNVYELTCNKLMEIIKENE